MCSHLRKLSDIFWVVCTLLPLVRTQSNFECAQILDTKFLDMCCGKTNLSNRMFEGTRCSQYDRNHGACAYDCLYSHWSLLNGDHKLNRHNLEAMIALQYENHTSYGAALHQSFVICEKLLSKYEELMYINALLRHGRQNHNLTVEKHCAEQPMYYGYCVAINLIVKCPPQLWQHTSDCDNTKRTVTGCLELLNDLSSPSVGRDEPSLRSAATGRTRLGRDTSTHWYTAFFNWLVF